MQLRSVYIFAVLMLARQNSFAGIVQVQQWIPWKFVTEQIRSVPLNLSQEMAESQINFDQLQPKISGLSVKLSGNVDSAEINRSSIALKAEKLSAQLHLDQLVVDQTIVRNLNGHQLKIRLKAICENISVQVTDFGSRANFVFQRENELVQPLLSDLELAMNEGNWVMAPVVCQGPAGIEQEIQGIVSHALSQPSNLAATFKKYLGPYLQAQVAELWRSLQSKSSNFQVKYVEDPTDLGVALRAEIETKTAGQVMLPLIDDKLLSSEKPQMVLSADGFQKLLEDALKELGKSKFNLQEVKDFHKLMKSRFFQFFVWPDLMNFAKDSPFWLSADLDHAVTNLKRSAGGQWELQLQTRGKIEAVRDGFTVDYIEWGLGMASSMVPKVTAGILSITTSQPSANINWNFAPEYRKQNHPSSWVSESLIKKSAIAAFENRTVSKDLPVIGIDDRIWKLSNWTDQDNLIQIDWVEEK